MSTVSGPSNISARVIKTRVQQFVSHHMNKTVEHQGKTLEVLAKSPKQLNANLLDFFMSQSHKSLIQDDILLDVKNALTEIMVSINTLPAVKRFYILETMDLFNSKVSIGKLIPPLLLLQGTEQKKAIAEFIRPTFQSINKNVEILTATSSIFNPKAIHLERGSLYTLIGDIAKILTQLFEEEYLESFTEVSSNVELLLVLFETNPIFQGDFDCKNPQKSNMINDQVRLRMILMEFISVIQTHEGLYNYALKRHAYYKLFVTNLFKSERFQGVSPFEVTQILSACLWANPQLEPPKELISTMLGEETYSLPETKQKYNEFIDQLTPSTVYKLIGNFRVSIQQITQSSVSPEFAQVQRLSVKNLLRNVWSSFIKFGEKIVDQVSTGFSQVFELVKKSYDTFLKQEGQAVPGNKANPKVRPLIPKNHLSMDVISRQFLPVGTDIKAFRGEYEGANSKDYIYNVRLFKQNELLLIRFKTCFEKLFRTLQSSRHLKVFSMPNRPALREYYVALQFGEFLLALGLTHQTSSNPKQIEESDLFPYVLLFRKSEETSYGRVLSRTLEGTGQNYNEEALTGNNSIVFYESLYHVLHYLPESIWNAQDTQEVLRFLVNELTLSYQSEANFIFLDEPPVLK